METRTHSFPTARIHIYINKLVHRLFFLFNFRFFLFPFFGERGGGGAPDEYQQGSEKCFAVNNSGIQSNFELHTPLHTHTHTLESNQSAKLPYLLPMKMELQKLAHLFWTIRVIEV